MNLDSKIDELYRLRLPEFTAARNALAKTLTGHEAKRVKALPKPTLVPWAVNQLYWKARAAYDRLMKSGEALRDAQIAALKGHAGDMQRATEQHRKALAEAVREATRIAGADGSRPGADELARMLEALSLASSRPELPGRFAELVQPAGFEALAGVTPVRIGPAHAAGPAKAGPQVLAGTGPAKTGARGQKQKAGVVSAFPQAKIDEARQRAEKAAAEEEEREIARRRQEAQANLKAAEQALERARATEAKHREAFDRAQEERREAEAALAAAKRLSSKF